MRPRLTKIKWATLSFLVAMCFVTSSYATAYHTIVCGSGGDETFSIRFNEWGDRLYATLTSRVQRGEERVQLLKSESPKEAGEKIDHEIASDQSSPEVHSATSLESIRELFSVHAENITNDDELFLYIIGHGSYIKRQSKLNIPGPDLTGVELATLLDAIPAKRIIVVNAMSRGAVFVNLLSGENRIICSATKSVEEANAPEFMEYFIQGLEDGSADRNRDDRISILEACQQANDLTQGWYINEGFVPTEHALIDDNGDKRGARLSPDIQTEEPSGSPKDAPDTLPDGQRAAESFIKDYVFPATASPDLIATYTNALEQIARLKEKKLSLSPEEYYSTLEKLLLEAATANRDIRSGAEDASEQNES
jgi:hypothetical protein